MTKSIGQDIYGQIVSAWRFMHLGLYFDKLMASGAQFPTIPDFTFNGLKIELGSINAALPKEFIGRNGESYFGSHTFFFSCREILTGVAEGLSKEYEDEYLTFKSYTKALLKEQYSSFDNITRFCRNVLSHNVTEHISLIESDFKSQKLYLSRKDLPMNAKVDITYSNLFGENYGFQGNFKLDVDFNKIQEGLSFFDFISQEKLMGLVTLIGSITETYIGQRANTYLESFSNKTK